MRTLPAEPDATGPTRWWWRPLVFAPLLLWLAWQIAATAFLCDDAFICFRYARNLLDGHGLVFNRGERVEGFTDFLWVLEIAGLWRLGVRPEIAAHVLSLSLTAGTLALTIAGARRLVAAELRLLAGWIACGLVAGCASFAVWSTGGLETRQFTFCVAAGVHLLGAPQRTRARLLAASLAFAAAELTRPEGLLVFAVAGIWLAAAERLDGRVRWSQGLAFALPFAVVVGAQFLWRHEYYGEWLPNAYYAKHVRAWYESGFRYLAAAAIELGAWLWAPLALLAAAQKAAARDLRPLLPAALVVAHAAYIAHIGGDHFEYRPLDFYLPVLAPAAAAGVLLLAQWAARWLRRHAPAMRAFAAAAGVLAIVYSHAIGTASTVVAMARQEPLEGLGERTRVDAASAPALRFLPGARALCDVLNPLREQLVHHLVAVPAQVHRQIGQDLTQRFAACERLPDGVLPRDAVALANAAGVMPFYLRDLTIVDGHGLTDHTIARTPATADNRARRMAHDRNPPPGYLEQRGVNLRVHGTAADELEALARADYALRIDEGSWLPFDAVDRLYAQTAFPAERLAMRQRVDPQHADGNHLAVGGRAYLGTALLATFDDAEQLDGWTCTGDAGWRPRTLLFGGVGKGQLSTRRRDGHAAGAGTARSPEFVPSAGESLAFLLAGERAVGLGVQLCRGDEVLRVIPPTDDRALLPCLVDVGAWAGASLHLELRDPGPGWLAIDHVLRVQPVEDARAAASQRWTPTTPPLASAVRIAPLAAAGDRATSGPTQITIVNPLPCALRVTMQLVAGPLDAALLTGRWRFADGSTSDVLPPGTTAQIDAMLQLPQPVPIDREPFLLRIRAEPQVTDAGLTAMPLVADLPLPWQR